MAAPLKAIVFGSTGAVGREVVRTLADSERWSHVVACVRRPMEKSDWASSNEDKIEVKIVNYDDIRESLSSSNLQDFSTVFYCLGSTRAEAGSAEKFVKIDQGYLKEIAPICKEADVKHFSLVSSIGACASSMFLYMKTKGENENFVKSLDFPYVSIWQPGLLGRGEKTRFAEKIYGFFSKEIPVATVAKAMAVDAENKQLENPASLSVFGNADIYNLSK